MDESTPREKVLKNVRNALLSKHQNPYPNLDLESPIYARTEDNLDILFAEELTKVGGKFIFCETLDEFLNVFEKYAKDNGWKDIFVQDPGLQELLSIGAINFISDKDKFLNAKIGFTRCESLIARLGSVMVSTGMGSGRKMHAYPDVHVVIAFSNQLVYDVKEALLKIKEKYENRLPSMISVITGPSRTADIEKTLVMGAHGPKEIFVFLIGE